MAIPKITSATFHTAVHRLDQLPREYLPEVAFLGRSNVGKSSLINTLVARQGLVRTSRQPGCTRSVNFFLINERWYFVDLPGYGYAAAPRQVQAGWENLIMTYLKKRESLIAVVFLQDPRRLPGKEDLILWHLLHDLGRLIIPVLTKADKVKQGARARHLSQIIKGLHPLRVAGEEFLWFSALTREGRDKLWQRLLNALPAKTSPASTPGLS